MSACCIFQSLHVGGQFYVMAQSLMQQKTFYSRMAIYCRSRGSAFACRRTILRNGSVSYATIKNSIAAWLFTVDLVAQPFM